MLGTRVGAAVFILVVLLGHAYVLRPRALADTQEKPASGKKNSTKEGERPSIAGQVHKGLKGLDAKIPAETSKAAKATKEGFKKRFNTTHEQKGEKSKR